MSFDATEDIEGWLREKNEDIAAWLVEKNRHDYAVVLASRAALRGIATFNLQLSRRPWGYRIPQMSARIMLFAFRAAAASWPCARYPSRCAEFVEPAEAAAESAFITRSLHWAGATEASTWAGSGFECAAAAAARPSDAFKDAARVVYDMAHAAHDIAGRESAPEDDACVAVFRDFCADVAMLENGTAPEELAAMPLWLHGTPKSAIAAWKRLASVLRARKENWEVWINWYERRLAGRLSDPEIVDCSFLLVPESLWKLGPRAANAAIAQINAGEGVSGIESREDALDHDERVKHLYVAAAVFGGLLGLLLGWVGSERSEWDGKGFVLSHPWPLPSAATLFGALYAMLFLWSHRAKQIAAGKYKASSHEAFIAASPRLTKLLHLANWATLGAFCAVPLTIVVLAVYWTHKLQGTYDQPPLDELLSPSTLFLAAVVGGGLTAAFHYWRKYVRPRDETVVETIGKVLYAIAAFLSRGKLVMMKLIWVIIGAVYGIIDVYITFGVFSSAMARVIVVILLGLPGLYWFFVRGAWPTWDTIFGARTLTKKDLRLGAADLANKEDAARAARGDSTPR
jgi:hypothetical protein